jgi:hypothetical protein
MIRKTIIILSFIVVSTAAFSKINPDSKVLMGISGDVNFSFVESNNSNTYYGTGIKLGYGIYENNIIYSSIEYQHKVFTPAKINHPAIEEPKYHQNFLDFNFVHRYLWDLVHLDTGIYYGKRFGEMYNNNGNVPENYTHDDAGVLIGAGLHYQIFNNFEIEINIVDKIGLIPIYDAKGYYNVRTISQVLSVGCLTYF